MPDENDAMTEGMSSRYFESQKLYGFQRDFAAAFGSIGFGYLTGLPDEDLPGAKILRTGD